MEDKASHYSTFVTYARKCGIGIDVEKRWNEWINFEASVIRNYGKNETVHGRNSVVSHQFIISNSVSRFQFLFSMLFVA
jgi:hypothetical protein